MKKQLKLKDLKLSSFITDKAENKQLKGGIDRTEWCSQPPCFKKMH
ncbi:MAG: pinensin family lanthipeptide [Cyclobacteriaceae bacterium]